MTCQPMSDDSSLRNRGNKMGNESEGPLLNSTGSAVSHGKLAGLPDVSENKPTPGYMVPLIPGVAALANVGIGFGICAGVYYGIASSRTFYDSQLEKLFNTFGYHFVKMLLTILFIFFSFKKQVRNYFWPWK